MRKRAFLTLMTAVLSVPLFSQDQTAGPFGFTKGMTREQIIQLVGKDRAKPGAQEDILIVSSAPKAHPAFEEYTLAISPKEGLLKVVAVGKTIQTGDTGRELRSAFEAISTAIAQKYGQPTTHHDFCNGGVGCTGDEYWMMSLLEKNRVLADFWEIKNPPNFVTAIAIEAKALRLNQGWLSVAFEFAGWDRYVDAKKEKQNSVF
jgi:hypothetical protein